MQRESKLKVLKMSRNLQQKTNMNLLWLIFSRYSFWSFNHATTQEVGKILQNKSQRLINGRYIIF